MKPKKRELEYKRTDTIVISDVHLGSRYSQTGKLYRFLDQLSERPPYRLIICGDAFELWSTNYKKIHAPEYRIMRKVIELSQKNTKVIYVPGNHDRAFRIFRRFSLGKIKLRSEYVVHDLKKKLLVIHGDEFDAFTRNHVVLTLVIDQFYVFLIRLSAFIKRFVGLNVSLAAQKNSKHYVKIVQKIKRAAIRYARERGFDGIIMGHTHWPEIFRDIDGILYANSGDWLENCSYLVIGDDVRLEYFR